MVPVDCSVTVTLMVELAVRVALALPPTPSDGLAAPMLIEPASCWVKLTVPLAAVTPVCEPLKLSRNHF